MVVNKQEVITLTPDDDAENLIKIQRYLDALADRTLSVAVAARIVFASHWLAAAEIGMRVAIESKFGTAEELEAAYQRDEVI